MTETLPGTYLVDPATLSTLQRVRYQDGIKGDITTAHPTALPNGDLVNFISTVRMLDWVRACAAPPHTRYCAGLYLFCATLIMAWDCWRSRLNPGSNGSP